MGLSGRQQGDVRGCQWDTPGSSLPTEPQNWLQRPPFPTPGLGIPGLVCFCYQLCWGRGGAGWYWYWRLPGRERVGSKGRRSRMGKRASWRQEFTE